MESRTAVNDRSAAERITMEINVGTSFVTAVDAYKESHKLTPDNIKQEDDWRKMSDKEWDKFVEHIDKYLDTAKADLEKKKELQEEAAQKAAGRAPADMKSIIAAQAVLKASVNGLVSEISSSDASELEKSSWTYEMETDDQVILAKAKNANEYAADMLNKAQEIAIDSVNGGVNEGGTIDSIITSQKKDTCPYSYLAKNGIIEYNGVTFVCDNQHNAITLGDVTSDPSKVLRIPLPRGGNLFVNVNNFDDLAKAAGMFSPEDLNAILRAIHTYKNCTSKINELEEEKNKSPEEIAKENVTMEKQEKLSNEEYEKRIMMLFGDWNIVKEELFLNT